MWCELKRLAARLFRQIMVLVVLAVLVTCLPAGAEEVAVHATVDRATVPLSQVCVLTVSVTGSREQPVLPTHDAFAIQPRGSASRVSIVNGRISSSVEYRYVLQPLRTGTFTIGPATITHDGRRVASSVLTVIVTDRPAAQPAGDTVFVTATLDDDQPFLHQQIICSFRFYRRLPVSNARLIATPSFDGFVSRQLGAEREFIEAVDGRSYTVTELRYALLPTRTGTLRIDSFQLACEVAQEGGRRSDPFDDLFFRMPRTQPRSLRSDALTLTVQPLPVADRPVDFAGLVGQFHLTGHLSADQVPAGESVTLTLVLSGTGNLATRQNLQLPDVPGCKVYDDAPVFEPDDTADQSGGVLTLKRALVPLRPGSLRIAPVSVAYFDPAEQRYRVATTSAFALRVSPADDPAAMPAPDNAVRRPLQQQIVIEGHDILPVQTSLDALHATGLPALLQVVSLLIAPWMLLAIVTIVVRVQRQRDPGRRARRAYARFQQQVRLAGGRESYAGGSRALRDLVGDLLDLPAAGMTADDMDVQLRAASIPDATRGAVVACVRQAEVAQFNPGVDLCDWETYRKRVLQAAADLNRVVKR